MVVFENLEGWNSKVNFVDSNNVLVGYDMYQQCCEHAEWYIAETVNGAAIETPDLAIFVFDKDFFQDIEEKSEYEEGGKVAFKLTSEDRVLYLHLSNSHNGYYSHGFTVEVGGEVIRSGAI